MTPTLLLDLTGAADTGWRGALADAGLHLDAACGGNDLVQRTAAEAPELVICLASGLTPAVAGALSGWAGEPPCAVLLLTPEPARDEAGAALAVRLGVHHWQAGARLDAPTLAAAGALALARRQREDAARAALARLQSELDDRKWVDRAKGVLMSARGMAEDEAFRLLRGAAMNVNLRVGEISRAVTEAAQWADAVNRAGQLRMLSQRFVRLVAQRLLKIDARAAATLEKQSTRRVLDNLEVLEHVCDGTPASAACARVQARWLLLAPALAQPRIDLPALLGIDRHADALLDAAEELTEALQEAAGRRALHIVNQCGRQRLRVLRIAKESLLAALLGPGAEADALLARRDAALDDFERAQRGLEQAPLSSPDIRAALALVRDDWLRLLGGLRAPDPADGRRALVQASETMLERLEALTAAYEHSLQVIMS